MDNPATWGDVEKVIYEVINKYQVEQYVDEVSGEVRCGLSLERQIADALRAAGLVNQPNGDNRHEQEK